MTKKYPLSAPGNPQEGLARLYESYREPFLRFVARLGMTDRDRALDIYHDSFMVMQRKWEAGELDSLTCSLKTWLFAVGRNQVLKALRGSREVGRSDFREELLTAIAADEPDTVHQRLELAGRAVEELREPCSTVLRLFYWDGCDMAEIARRMSYRNAQVAKNRKLICMKTLREVLRELFIEHGLEH